MKVYNIVKIRVPFDYKYLDDYVIGEVKIKDGDLKIVLIKKAVLE